MSVYAATGASGHLGGFAVQQLLGRGVPQPGIVAVVRTRGKADLAARDVHVRVADYSRPQTLGAPHAGVDRLPLVSGNEDGRRVAQHTNVVAAARIAGVSRIVYTSMLNADHTSKPLVGEHLDSDPLHSKGSLCDADVRLGIIRKSGPGAGTGSYRWPVAQMPAVRWWPWLQGWRVRVRRTSCPRYIAAVLL
jgi:hypothetical protein